LLNFLSSHQSAWNTYLCLKLLAKALHRVVDFDVKELACAWMPVVQKVIASHDSALDLLSGEFEPRSPAEIFYFSSKKWALYIVTDFLHKHASETS
jgi:hypothetical protein